MDNAKTFHSKRKRFVGGFVEWSRQPFQCMASFPQNHINESTTRSLRVRAFQVIDQKLELRARDFKFGSGFRNQERVALALL